MLNAVAVVQAMPGLPPRVSDRFRRSRIFVVANLMTDISLRKTTLLLKIASSVTRKSNYSDVPHQT